MTCQNRGVLCFLWSFAMTSVTWSHPADTKSHLLPPEIVEGPNFHEIFQVNNDRKELPCIATGTPPITYKWLFNGEEVILGEHMRIVDGRLYINNPIGDMEGYYQCRASNEAGIAMSNITFLQAAVFEYSSTRERNWVRKLSARELDHVVLPCHHITRSVPRDAITWELSTDGGNDFRRVQLGDRVTQAQSGSLVFSFVRKNNSAIYKCISFNRIILKGLGGSKVNLTIETQESSVMERRLTEPPVLLYATSPDVTVLEGEELRLECLFGAWPVHEVEWTTPSSVTSVSHAWVIRNASVADAGVYSCQARKMAALNRHLLSSPVNISVQVDAIPSFIAPLDNQEVPASGRDVTFRCQGRGRPSPKVTWYKNGAAIDKLEDVLDHSISGDGPTSVLVLKNIRTSATVTCNISNAHGYRLQSAFVAMGATELDADNISSSSSHDVIITSQMTSTDRPPSTRPYHVTMLTYPQHKSTTASRQSSTAAYRTKPVEVDEKNTANNTNNSPAPHVVDSPLSTVTTIVIPVSVGVVVIALGFVVVVVIIIRQRRRRGSFSLTEQELQLRQERLRVRDERVYDSDDSGFDDLKAEHERRALQGHQPSS